MKIRVIAIASKKNSLIEEEIKKYTRRLPASWQAENILLRSPKHLTQAQQSKELESAKILSNIKNDEFVILLDEAGSQMTSRQFSSKLTKLLSEKQSLVFIVAGSAGASDRLKDKANELWSLSSLSFTHALARLLLFEQLYRAWSLASGHPYHRE